MYGFIGLSLFMFLKKHPNESRSLMTNASELVKFLPIDSNAGDLLTPIFDFTNVNNKLERFTNPAAYGVTPQFKRMVGSGNYK